MSGTLRGLAGQIAKANFLTMLCLTFGIAFAVDMAGLTAGVNLDRASKAIEVLGLAVMVGIALARTGRLTIGTCGSARTALDALKERHRQSGGRPVDLGIAMADGRITRRWSVVDPGSIATPSRWSNTLVCPVLDQMLTAAGIVEANRTITFEGKTWEDIASTHEDERFVIRLDAENVGFTRLRGRGAAAPAKLPRGITPRAAAALGGHDMRSPAGRRAARRAMARLHHADADGSTRDTALLMEINAAIDAYAADENLTETSKARGE